MSEKAKELKSNPFKKIQNKFLKELDLIQKILKDNEKFIESEKDKKLQDSIEKLLLKTKDPIQAQIRGNVLKSLKYIDFSNLFYNKASELGYNLNENIDITDVDIDIESKIREDLINRTIQVITKADEKTKTINDIIFNNDSIILVLDDSTEELLKFRDLSKLIDGFQIVKTAPSGVFYALMINENNQKKNMKIEENKYNKIIGKSITYKYQNFNLGTTAIIENIEIKDNKVSFIINGNINEDNNITLSELEELLNKGTCSIFENEEEINMSLNNNCECDGNCTCNQVTESNEEILNTELNQIESWLKNTTEQYNDYDWDGETLTVFTESGTQTYTKLDLIEVGAIKENFENNSLEHDIAVVLLPKIQEIKNETGIFTVQDLENHILNNGGTLEMTDLVMSELVNMGFNFDNNQEDIENDEEFLLGDNDMKLYTESITEALERIEETENTGSFKKLRFNHHTVHNPNYDILEGWINDHTFITYALNIDTQEESMEYYIGDNYTGSNGIKSYSRHFKSNIIPNKYKSLWLELKSIYEEKYKNITESFTQQMPLVDEFKNYNLFDLESPEKSKKDYTPETIFNLIQSDPFLRLAYRELQTGNYEEDMEMVYNTYIKDNEELKSKAVVMDSYINMIKEEQMNKTPFRNKIDVILRVNNLNEENHLDEIYRTLSFLDDNINEERNSFNLLTPDVKQEIRDYFLTRTENEISDMLLTEYGKSENVFNLTDIANQYIVNLLESIKSKFRDIDIDNIKLKSVLFSAVFAIIIKSL